MSYDRKKTMPLVPGLRLLPWTTQEGNPCFLSTEGKTGVLASLADEVESEQLRDADGILKDGQAVLNDDESGEHATRHTLKATLSALSDALRVADSRGARLPDPYDEDGEGPQLPAEAFG